MDKHAWMLEVIDDLTYYALSNDLKQVSAELKKAKKTFLKTRKEPKSNVVRFDAMAAACKR